MSHEKDRIIRRHELQVGGAGLALGAGTYLLDELPSLNPAMHGEIAGLGYTGAGLLAAAAIGHYRWYFSREQRFLRELGTRGWVDRHDLQDSCGSGAMRAKGGQIRPSLKGRHPVNEYGLRVGRLVSGSRPIRGRSVYSPWSRGVVVVGPQGSGKTQWLLHAVLDSPGPSLVASTKPELAALTAPLREEIGQTLIFNPQDLGTLGSTFQWDPVSGCHDQATADARAWALVRGGGGAEGIERPDFWASRAQEIIRCYLMAAAINGWDMSAVMHWSNNPDDPTPLNVLEANAQLVPPGWVGMLRSRLEASHNTRTGYFATVTACTGFMDNPTVAAACRPTRGQHFDVAKFLTENQTLYLVGGAEDRRIAPLLTALTEHVFNETKRTAATKPGGRVDPTLNFFGDEIANITPVPLDQWASDSRGWGITVVAVVQALSQFATTWGQEKAKTIWANLPTKVVLPGVSDDDDLEMLSYLSGTRTVQSTSEGESQTEEGRQTRSSHRSYQRERVAAGHTISNMPAWHAYVLGLGRHPAVVRFAPGHRRAKRELRRLGRRRAKSAAGEVLQAPAAERVPAP